MGKCFKSAYACFCIPSSLEKPMAKPAVGLEMAALGPLVPCIDEHEFIAFITLPHEINRGCKPIFVIFRRSIEHYKRPLPGSGSVVP